MALKASGAYKNCKPCSRSCNDIRNRNYAESDTNSESARFHYSYRRTMGSSNSTPRLWGKEMDSRLKALSSGEGTPASVSGRTESIVLMEEDEPKEWVAQVEPGVIITFVSLPQGGNDLKRIRFRYFLLFGVDMMVKILILVECECECVTTCFCYGAAVWTTVSFCPLCFDLFLFVLDLEV